MGLTGSCRRAEVSFFFAIRQGDQIYVKDVLKAKPKAVNYAISYSGLSPLHYAALHGQSEVLTLLLERGADMNALNSHRQTPLMLACKNGKLSCVDLLIEQGAEVLTFDSANGRTCLHYAAKRGYLSSLRRILDAGRLPPVADTWGFSRFVNVRDRNGASPLHLAASACHFTVVRCLLENGAVVCALTTRSTNRWPDCGSTPLHFAARGGSIECVREILAWGADRNHRDSEGYTPYLVALKYNNSACAALLNPCSAELFLWPSPWKFMSELDPGSKVLLEAALTEVNKRRQKDIPCQSMTTRKIDDNKADGGEPELCCICFDNTCTIQLQDCGHQMCAECTVSLCYHNKPNPSTPNSPPPVCPFCRGDIKKLNKSDRT